MPAGWRRNAWPAATWLLITLAGVQAEASTADTIAAANAASAHALAEDAAPASDPDALFANAELLELQFAGPIMAIASDGRPKPEEQSVTMTWTAADGTAADMEIDVRARGKSRRDADKCAFPPLRLDIPRSRAAGTLFQNQDKLKLVTHCRPLGSRATGPRDWIALEYFAYRILNHVTEHSFRVRPLQVTYVAEDERRYRHPGFLIEDKDRMAHRLGLQISDIERTEQQRLAPALTQIMEVFQYAIGNTDFSFLVGPDGERCCHNAVLMTAGMDASELIPVPYDFDITGIVNKPGSIPAADLDIRYVTERRYRGFCRDPAHLDSAVARFVAVRADINAELAALPGLSQRGREQAQAFLDDFYTTVTDAQLQRAALLDQCRS